MKTNNIPGIVNVHDSYMYSVYYKIKHMRVLDLMMVLTVILSQDHNGVSSNAINNIAAGPPMGQNSLMRSRNLMFTGTKPAFSLDSAPRGQAP
jgi:hypothetical protein